MSIFVKKKIIILLSYTGQHYHFEISKMKNTFTNIWLRFNKQRNMGIIFLHIVPHEQLRLENSDKSFISYGWYFFLCLEFVVKFLNCGKCESICLQLYPYYLEHCLT